MTEEQILKLMKEARAEGEKYGIRFGFGQAIGIVQGYLALLNDPDMSYGIPSDQLFARRDQLEKVLKAMVEQDMQL
ncbi:MAG TPA: hypothetical protein VJZ77_09300 [Blastocatellia bacterium]|nr:hypothetical protein [Blastocatellia bacterium]